MFTGIIADVGEVLDIDSSRGDVRFRIGTSFDMDQFKIGASIACSGCCLTVVEKGSDWFDVDVSTESFDKTNLGSLVVGSAVNLESSMRLGDEFGGHVVSGHVDGLLTLVSVAEDGDSHRLVFDVPDEFVSYFVPKGSVTIQGISLTVNEVEGSQFGVCIIPHTWGHTDICNHKPQDKLNFEVDMMARYVARLMDQRFEVMGITAENIRKQES